MLAQINDLNKALHKNAAKYQMVFVDDEPNICKYFARLYKNLIPAKIVTCERPKEALEYIKNNHQHIALVMVDELMPEMTGHELLDIVNHDYPDIFKLMSSVISSTDLKKTCDNIQINLPPIQKPWHPPDIAQIIATSLNYFVLQNDKILQKNLQKLDNYIFQSWLDNLNKYPNLTDDF